MTTSRRPRWSPCALALLSVLPACGRVAPGPDHEDGTRVVLDEIVVRFLESKSDGTAGELGSRVMEITPAIDSKRPLFVGFARRRALALPPGERAAYRVDVPEQARLEFGVALDSSALEAGSTGMEFEVLVDGRSIWRQTLQAVERKHLESWSEATVALTAFAGRTVEITFATHPGPKGDATGDLGGFCDPLLVQSSSFQRQRSDPQHPNLMLVLVDTLRADALGSSGSAGPKTPNIDRLAQEGLVFERAYSAAPWTMPSVASIFTGLHVESHGTIGLSQPRLLDQHETLAESLTRMGVATHGFVANPLISPAQNYDQGFGGFEIFHDDSEPRIDCTLLLQAAGDWIVAQGDGQWFAYVHVLDPHDPYEPPPDLAELMVEPYSGPFPKANTQVLKGLRTKLIAGKEAGLSERDVRYFKELYAAEVTAWDRSLGNMLDALGAAGRLENTLIVLTSDHGEEFFEHGLLLHGHDTSEELVHVPLIFWRPGVVNPGRTDTPVTLVDLRATLLRSLGAQQTGPTLFEVVAGAPGSALLFSTQGGPDSRNQIAGLVDGRWKVKRWTDSEVYELYDLQEDPGEAHDLLAGQPLAELSPQDPRRLKVAEFTRQHGLVPVVQQAAASESSPQALEALRALGYVE